MSITLNQYAITTIAEFISFPNAAIVNGAWIMISGKDAENDGKGGLYYYSTSSTLTPDGFNVLKQDIIVGAGRAVRWSMFADWLESNPEALGFIKNKPTIPAPQIPADWAQSNPVALDYVKNKPALAAVATSGAYADLSGKPSLATVATTGAYADLTGKPSIKKMATYLGSTDVNGNYTVTYGTAFSVTPDVQPQLQAPTVNQQVRITASSTTGFTVNASQRAVLSVLGLDVLAGTATALASASVSVLVTER